MEPEAWGGADLRHSPAQSRLYIHEQPSNSFPHWLSYVRVPAAWRSDDSHMTPTLLGSAFAVWMHRVRKRASGISGDHCPCPVIQVTEHHLCVYLLM